MATRRKAREVALQAIFEQEFNDCSQAHSLRFIARRLERHPRLADWSAELFLGVVDNLEQLDQQLDKLLNNWKMERVFAADLALLRMAAYELLFTETPAAVVINEAIELAKRFGHAKSHQFINGVLDRLRSDHAQTAENGA